MILLNIQITLVVPFNDPVVDVADKSYTCCDPINPEIDVSFCGSTVYNGLGSSSSLLYKEYFLGYKIIIKYFFE
jgi:hypothetical protein